MIKKKKVVNGLYYLILVSFLAVVLFPLIYTFFASFKSNMEIFVNPGSILPKEFTLENYRTAWNSEDFNVKILVWNSIYYTLILVAAGVLKSAMAGYVFNRAEFPGKKLLFAAFSSLLFLKLGTITVYPLFDILNAIKLNKSLFGLIFIKLFSINVVHIYLVKSFVEAIPRQIDEAAQIDGCSFGGTFFRIVLPLLKPVLATIGILNFSASWNEYLMPTIFTLSNPSQRTLIAGVVALKSSGYAASSWNLMLAGSVIALIPVLIAYAFCNKLFVVGVTSGAVKG